MKTLKTVLLAGAVALAGTVAFAQGMNDQTKAPHNAGTDQGTANPAHAAPTVGMDAGAKAKASGTTGTTMNSKKGAEIGPNNTNGSRPSEDLAKPGDMNKTR